MYVYVYIFRHLHIQRTLEISKIPHHAEVPLIIAFPDDICIYKYTNINICMYLHVYIFLHIHMQRMLEIFKIPHHAEVPLIVALTDVCSVDDEALKAQVKHALCFGVL